MNVVAKKERHLNLYCLSQFEFLINCGEDNDEVNMLKKECSCGRFLLIGIPCIHAITAAVKCHTGLYMLFSPLYVNES